MKINEKHSRQSIIPEIGLKGQLKLKSSQVLIIGAGGLGIPAALYLASSGVGKIGIVDNDIIEESNLGRQVLYNYNDIGQKKSKTLCEKLLILNPDVSLISYDAWFCEENAMSIAQEYDLILNASDNFETRFLINKIALKLEVPWINCAVTKLSGQLSVHYPNKGCYVCLFPQKQNKEKSETKLERNCSLDGILAPLCGMFGSWAATYSLNILLKINVEENIFYHYDSKENRLKNFRWKKNESCPVCSNNLKYTLNKQSKTISNFENSLFLQIDDFYSMLKLHKNLIVLDFSSFYYEFPEKVENKPKIQKINFSDLFSRDLEEPKIIELLNKDNIYVCVCEYGVKSSLAASIIHQEGGFQVFYTQCK